MGAMPNSVPSGLAADFVGKPAAGAMHFGVVTMVYPSGTTSLEDVSFTVEPGEIVAIVGPSGCGKSTLLRLAAGLEQATSGQVEVNSENLGYVFQDANLLPWRSVLKNVELFAELDRRPVGERRHQALEVLQLVGLEGFEHQYPGELSGGMRMRASLARTLVTHPQICLFDEPFGALDELTRAQMHDEVLQLHQQIGFTGLLVTHSISEAVYLASRVLVMSGRPGRLLADFKVPLPFPRDQSMQFDPAYAESCRAIQLILRGEKP